MANDNLLSCTETTDNKYTRWDGFSSVVLNQYTTFSTQTQGITWDGIDVYLCGQTNQIRQYYGFSNILQDSILVSGRNFRGLSHDKINLISADTYNDEILKHLGFSDVITDYFSASNPEGVCWNGLNTIVNTTALVTKYLGFSNVVLDSFDPPGSRCQGVTTDGTDFYVCDRNNFTYYKLQGFSNIILDSYGLSGKSPSDVEWENIDARLSPGAGAGRRFSNQFNPFNLKAA